ncbi:MAG: DUF4352 domain-containing protein [Bacillota bacterium]
MKKIFLLSFLVAALLLGGCASTQPQVPPHASNREEKSGHIKLVQGPLTLEVSQKPKYFSPELMPAEKGKVVIGLFTAITNDSDQDLTIKPEFVTIITEDGKSYQYSETRTAITGKGAFKAMDLPPHYRGGGLLLFEIPRDQQVDKVLYEDQAGHKFTVNLLAPPGKV